MRGNACSCQAGPFQGSHEGLIEERRVGCSIPTNEDKFPRCAASEGRQCLDRSGVQGNGAGLTGFRKGGRHGQDPSSKVNIIPPKGEAFTFNPHAGIDGDSQEAPQGFGTLGQEPRFFLGLKISETLLRFLCQFDADGRVDPFKQVPLKGTIEEIL
jgi:hypothetical protein